MKISNETRDRLIKDLSNDELEQELANRCASFDESVYISCFGDIRLKGRTAGSLEIYVPHIGPGFVSANRTEVLALRDTINRFLDKK